MRRAGIDLTIAYRLDSLHRFPDDVALHKTARDDAARVPPNQGYGLSPSMRCPALPVTAALPALLDYPRAAPPAHGEVIEIAARMLWLRMPLPFAARRSR